MKKSIALMSVVAAFVAAPSMAQHAEGQDVQFHVGAGYLVNDMAVQKEDGFSVEAGVGYKSLGFDVVYQDLGQGAELMEYKLTNKYALSDSFDLVVGASYLNPSKTDNDAYSLSLGAKTKVFDVVDLGVAYERVDFNFDADDMDFVDTGVVLSAGVEVAHGVTLAVEHREVLDQTGVKVSWAF